MAPSSSASAGTSDSEGSTSPASGPLRISISVAERHCPVFILSDTSAVPREVLHWSNIDECSVTYAVVFDDDNSRFVRVFYDDRHEKRLAFLSTGQDVEGKWCRNLQCNDDGRPSVFVHGHMLDHRGQGRRKSDELEWDPVVQHRLRSITGEEKGKKRGRMELVWTAETSQLRARPCYLSLCCFGGR